MSTGKRIRVCLYICLMVAALLADTAAAFSQESDLNDASARTLIIDGYRRYFGLDIPSPAYVKTRVSQKLYRYTSTAYIGNRRYRIYLERDGTIEADVSPAKRPCGTYRVAVVAIDHGNTNISALLTNLWVDVQQELNDNYATFSSSHGYAQPILHFANTNLLASSSEIANPRSSTEIISFVESRGYRQEDFDIFVSLNLDPQHPSGGFSGFGSNFVYVGYYSSQATYADLSTAMSHGKPQLFWIGKTVYDHECGHIFGWEHEWTPWDSNKLFADELITSPVLYGWLDTDGDGIPEILDPTPYGMSEAAAAAAQLVN
jgi:hypothetical protein